ncbi:hypothetical protein D9C73_015647 [Collichthys lucidus]|uniref:Uncharacterized protein n=1 Tax=Collichthys lucidus TaxID=240159 RepID=A0A4V6AQS0_COLLU|nr:hypothetical protein D9C73_015647 [Collichthys lucidus]
MYVFKSPRSKKERSRDRKRRREERRLQDVEEVPLKRFSCSESVPEASVEADNVPGLGTGREEDALLRDTMEAAKWCSAQQFKGKLSLPQVIAMDQKGRLRAVERLRISEGLDEEENERVRKPFLFLFSLQEDHESFCTEIMDTRHFQAFSAFV